MLVNNFFHFAYFFQGYTGNYANADEPRRKRQEDVTKPNHVLLFTIINPMYPITVVSFFFLIVGIPTCVIFAENADCSLYRIKKYKTKINAEI